MLDIATPTLSESTHGQSNEYLGLITHLLLALRRTTNCAQINLKYSIKDQEVAFT